MAARPFLALAVLALTACSAAEEGGDDVAVKEPAAGASASATAHQATEVIGRTEQVGRGTGGERENCEAKERARGHWNSPSERAMDRI